MHRRTVQRMRFEITKYEFEGGCAMEWFHIEKIDNETFAISEYGHWIGGKLILSSFPNLVKYHQTIKIV